ncbi:MAG: hypothetical protein U0U67_11305 [Chitinophagales bacterium]
MNKLIIILSAVCFIFTTACKKDNSTNNFDSNLTNGRCRVFCTINGAITMDYASQDVNSFSAYNSVSMALAPDFRNTTTGERATMEILVPISTTPGSYHLTDAGAPNISFTFTKDNIYSGVGNSWNATVGSNMTFVLTKSSYTELEGTFNGTAVSVSDGSTITITNGKFKTVFTH